MNAARHVYEIYIKSTPEQVWQAITDPDFTVQYFHRTRIESTFVQGDPYRYVMADGGIAIQGEIEEIERGRRLVMTFQFQNHSGMPDEPPSRVEWVITPAGDVTRLTLRHGDLFKSPKTWASVRMGWLPVVDGLKTLLETGEPLGAIDDPAADEVADDPEGEWHRTQGIAANNGTWDLLGKADDERTADDEEQMTLSAYAAAYHWARAARRGPENIARADWLLSRVWVVRGNGVLALHHADIVMRTCVDNDLRDFDLAYAYEARARSLACLGRLAEAAVERAAASSTPIIDDEDRSIVEADLGSEPWFGLDSLAGAAQGSEVLPVADSLIAETPSPPYTAVIFTNIRSAGNEAEYAATAARMTALAAQQPGYLGIETVREGVGITVSYWATDVDAAAWKRIAEHAEAQRIGREHWYARYRVRIATVTREYGSPGAP